MTLPGPSTPPSASPSPAPARPRLLLMSIGSLVGTALLEGFEALGRERFELIGTNSEAGAANNFRLDHCHLAPLAREHALLFPQLDALVARHDPALVIPTRDDDVVALAHWAASRGFARALVGAPAMADVIRDKWLSHQWALGHGLRFAPSAIEAAGIATLVQAHGLPLIAKPRLGFGSHGVRLLVSAEQVALALAAGDQVLQRPIDAPPMLTTESLQRGLPLWFAPVQAGSALALCHLDASGVRYVAGWQSQHVRGAAIDTVLLQDEALQALGLACGEAAWRDGWSGLFSLQARRDAEGVLWPIELAGRFMGGTNALLALGIPLLAQVLAPWLPGMDLGPLQAAPRWHTRIVKQTTTLAVELADEARLRDSGHWSRG